LSIFIVSAVIVAAVLCLGAAIIVALDTISGGQFYQSPVAQASDYIGVFIFQLFWLTVYIYAAYSWKYPITQLNRLRLYERKSMQVKPNEVEKVIPIRKSWYLDKNRYLRIRRNFLGMKMGYNPTDKKVDCLLKHLRCDLGRTNNYRKQLMQIDIDILTAMKEGLAAGTLKLENYTAEYEERDQKWMRWPTWPVNVMLFFALVTAILLAVGSIEVVTIFHSEETIGVLGFLFFAGLLMARYGILSAENVLRRSRDKIPRLKANIAQWTIIGAAIGIFFLMNLSLLAGIFKLLLA